MYFFFFVVLSTSNSWSFLSVVFSNFKELPCSFLEHHMNLGDVF